MFKSRKLSKHGAKQSGNTGGSSSSFNDIEQEAQDDGDHSPPTEPSHISNSAYNKRCKDLLDLYRDLRELGAQMYFDLPRISVIGSQSAGKSSLVEAVSGINVPRDSGTCTRCPMELSMTQAPEWSCTISLRLQFDADGNPYPDLRTKSFGSTLTKKEDVEIWLRRAQAAILSPHIDSHQFHSMPKDDVDILRETDSRMLSFSKNTIHIDVKDPEVTGLSFIDLPGLIQNSDTPALIDLVKDLVVSNIEGDNTLILIAIPMSDDIENQQAVRLAKEADPTGERTIGVLTKPDVVLPSSIGQLQRWKDVLEGNAYQLKHGYYCVRLPDQAERMEKLSRADSERRADGFFRTRDPWSKMALRTRFGIPNLVKDVSELLVRWIEKNLPTIQKQLLELLDQCKREMGALPSLIEGEPTTEVLLRLGAFCRGFRDAVCATEEKVLARQARKRYYQFKMEILRTTPDFRPFYDYKKYHRISGPSGDHEVPESYRTPPMDLGYVRQVIKDSVGWELPGHVPFEATKVLVTKSTQLWEAPSLACFDDIYQMTVAIIEKLIQEHFGQFSRAEKHIRALVNAELDIFRLNAQQAVEKLLQAETDPLFTQNFHYFEGEQNKWYAYYTAIRPYHYYCVLRSDETPCSYKTDCADCSRPPRPTELPAGAYSEPEPEDSNYYEELKLMSRVHAYFRVAYKRIIDYLPLTIEHSLNRSIDSSLYERLLEKLTAGSNYAEELAELLEENPELVKKRRVLSERHARLLQIKQRLDKLRLP